MSAPSICIVLPHIYPVLSRSRSLKSVGGAEVQHTIAATSLAKAGYKVSFVSLDFGQSDAVCHDGVTVYKSHVPTGGLPVLRFIYPRLFNTWQAMKRANADIYLQPCAGYLTGVIVAFCKVHGRKSVFVGASDTDFIPSKLRLSGFRDKFFYNWGLKNCSGVIAQTEKQKLLCEQNYGTGAEVIPNAYAPPLPRPNNRKDYVLWVGSIRSVKRPDRFIQIAKACPDINFRMIGGPTGDGPEPIAYYEQIKAEAATVPNLEFLGYLPFDVAEEHFDHASVFVNTSEFEGFPNTFLQAWSRGIPTVSTFDPNVSEQGVFWKVGDVTEAITAIRELVCNQEASAKYASHSLAYFSAHHCVEANVVRYGKFFSGLMSGTSC